MPCPSVETSRAERVTPRWAVLAAVASTLLFTAMAFVGIRHLSHTFSPGAMALGRLVVGSLVLGAAVVVTRSWKAMSSREWTVTTTVGVLLFGVYSIALNAGERRVDAGTAALVSQVAPAAIALLAVLVLRERLSVNALVGMILALAGVAAIAAGSWSGMGGDPVGVVLCLAAAISYAISAVLEKPLVTRLPAVQITWVACTVGALICLPFAGSLRRAALVASATDLGWLAFLGVGPTAVAFTAFAFALRYMNASVLGITTYLIAPLTIVLSLFILSETPPVSAFLGGALTLVGVALAQRGSSRTPSAPTRRLRPIRPPRR